MTQKFNIEDTHYERFRFERDGRILTATICSSNPVNAVDAIMHEELATVFTDLQRDSESDIIILTAAGKAFCAGGDFDWFDSHISDPDSFRNDAWTGRRIVTSLLEVDKPLLCRLNGAAAGLGATIALLCDVIVADENAIIGDPHVKVGLVAGDGGAVIWPQLVGYAKAKELLMTGDMLTAREAQQLGLINYAVPSDELDSKVGEIVRKIQGNPRWAVRWTKSAVNVPLRALAAQIMDASLGWEVASNYDGERKKVVEAARARTRPRKSD